MYLKLNDREKYMLRAAVIGFLSFAVVYSAYYYVYAGWSLSGLIFVGVGTQLFGHLVSYLLSRKTGYNPFTDRGLPK